MEIPIILNKDEVEFILDALDNEINFYNQSIGTDDEDKEYRDILIALSNKISKDYQKFFTIREKTDQTLTNPDFLEIH